MEPAMIHTSKQSGFAMLYTVLLVSLILTIAISISNLTLKQSVLSNLAKDSGIAFYQADAAVECGMYQDIALGHFPLDATVNTGAQTDVPEKFTCGPTMLYLDQSTLSQNYFEYTVGTNTTNTPCVSIIFDKTRANAVPEYSKVTGTGYSVCTNSPRQVQRSLEVKY